MEETRCTAIRAEGQSCEARALPDAALCRHTIPTCRRSAAREGQRRGGHAKSNAARAAKMWAAVGREIPDQDLPALLKATILGVRAGRVESGVATAIATLAKTALQLHGELEIERRLEALEAAVGTRPGPRRIA